MSSISHSPEKAHKTACHNLTKVPLQRQNGRERTEK